MIKKEKSLYNNIGDCLIAHSHSPLLTGIVLSRVERFLSGIGLRRSEL